MAGYWKDPSDDSLFPIEDPDLFTPYFQRKLEALLARAVQLAALHFNEISEVVSGKRSFFIPAEDPEIAFFFRSRLTVRHLQRGYLVWLCANQPCNKRPLDFSKYCSDCHVWFHGNAFPTGQMFDYKIQGNGLGSLKLGAASTFIGGGGQFGPGTANPVTSFGNGLGQGPNGFGNNYSFGAPGSGQYFQRARFPGGMRLEPGVAFGGGNGESGIVMPAVANGSYSSFFPAANGAQQGVGGGHGAPGFENQGVGNLRQSFHPPACSPSSSYMGGNAGNNLKIHHIDQQTEYSFGGGEGLGPGNGFNISRCEQPPSYVGGTVGAGNLFSLSNFEQQTTSSFGAMGGGSGYARGGYPEEDRSNSRASGVPAPLFAPRGPLAQDASFFDTFTQESFAVVGGGKAQACGSGDGNNWTANSNIPTCKPTNPQTSSSDGTMLSFSEIAERSGTSKPVSTFLPVSVSFTNPRPESNGYGSDSDSEMDENMRNGAAGGTFKAPFPPGDMGHQEEQVLETDYSNTQLLMVDNNVDNAIEF